MHCNSPSMSESRLAAPIDPDNPLAVSFGFIMDNVVDLRYVAHHSRFSITLSRLSFMLRSSCPPCQAPHLQSHKLFSFCSKVSLWNYRFSSFARTN